MIDRLRQGIGQWRRLGARQGTGAAVALASRPLRVAIRRTRLRRRPLGVAAEDLRRALGCREPRELLRGPVLDALPTVAAFERKLERMPAEERSGLLESARRIAAHEFDLLGSGPTLLGPEIDWSQDFKSGRSWPLDHISRLVTTYPDDSDIKVPWELSRFQHLPVLAAAYQASGDPLWVTEVGSQLEHWITRNPVEFGPNWLCTMDVAIRAANWTAALALLADVVSDEPWLDRTLGSLLLHGRFIRTHLEWAPVRGNHYLSDVVGLLCVAALFAEGSEGRSWADWAAQEVVAELRHQVRPDGSDHEASIPYHRLVAELFVCGVQAADALAPGVVTDADRETVERMLQFVSDYTRPDGTAPQVGDSDDGRFLPLGDYARADPRSHSHLFEQAGVAAPSATRTAAYPDGGYWIMRQGDTYVLVRCGDVGVGGTGSHAHNDALSFEFALGGQPLVVDPGAYVYTADPIERTRFRSTAFHSTLSIDGAEQNLISPDRLFSMDDRRDAKALSWGEQDGRVFFRGAHRGYETLNPPALHTRSLELDGASAILTIVDTVESQGAHQLEWTFPLAPCTVVSRGEGLAAQFGSGVELEISGDVDAFWAEDEWYSPSYGRRVPTPFVRARKRSSPGADTTTITLTARRDARGGQA